MKLQSILPLGAREATHQAMKWLQSLTDAYRSGVLIAGPHLTEEEVSEIDREMALFTSHVLPRLHSSFGTDPEHKATFHLHCLGTEEEEACDD